MYAFICVMCVGMCMCECMCMHMGVSMVVEEVATRGTHQSPFSFFSFFFFFFIEKGLLLVWNSPSSPVRPRNWHITPEPSPQPGYRFLSD